jgi:hypothetical protein
MSYLQEPKDPAEILTIGFDFASITDTPTSPVISITVRWGTETVPTLLTQGPASIVGSIVYQRIIAGANLHDYNLKCLADTPSGDKVAVDCVLAVRTRPV